MDGWAKLHQRFGKLPWSDLFQPAIYFAEHGYPVTEMISAAWAMEAGQARARTRTRASVFLPTAAPPKPGQVFRNPEMAAALKLIAEQGESAFYRGAIAKAILKTSERLGGKMTAADLSEFQAEWVEPISTDYHGWKVYELPPNGQGIAALEMLNIMSLFPLADYAPRGVEELHMQIEAQKLAYADLHRYVADPRFAKVPAAGMLSMEYARERAKLIDPEKAHCEVLPGKPPAIHGDTIYLSVVDRDGNIVSLIQSLYRLSARAWWWTITASRCRTAAGCSRWIRATPTRSRRPQAAVPHHHSGVHGEGRHAHGLRHHGRLNQAQAHAQFVSNIVDHGMNIQMALEAPRFTKTTLGGCDVPVENRIAPEVIEGLEAKGHKIEVLGDYNLLMGGGQAVIHDSATGVNYGASDPRKDGAAVPEPGAYFGK